MSNVDMASADAKPKRVVRRFEGWALALALASAGAVVGFAISESRLVVIVADLNTAHREETQRLIESYGGRVLGDSGSVIRDFGGCEMAGSIEVDGVVVPSVSPPGMPIGGAPRGLRGPRGLPGFAPWRIDDSDIFVIPDDAQVISAMPIEIDGILQIDGFLIEV